MGLGYDQGPSLDLGPSRKQSSGDGGGVCVDLRLLLPLGAVQGPIVEPHWYPRALLPWGTYQSGRPAWPPGTIVTNWAAAEDHVWAHGPAVAGVCVDVPGPRCRQGPHGCPGSGP